MCRPAVEADGRDQRRGVRRDGAAVDPDVPDVVGGEDRAGRRARQRRASPGPAVGGGGGGGGGGVGGSRRRAGGWRPAGSVPPRLAPSVQPSRSVSAPSRVGAELLLRRGSSGRRLSGSSPPSRMPSRSLSAARVRAGHWTRRRLQSPSGSGSSRSSRMPSRSVSARRGCVPARTPGGSSARRVGVLVPSGSRRGRCRPGSGSSSRRFPRSWQPVAVRDRGCRRGERATSAGPIDGSRSVTSAVRRVRDHAPDGPRGRPGATRRVRSRRATAPVDPVRTEAPVGPQSGNASGPRSLSSRASPGRPRPAATNTGSGRPRGPPPPASAGADGRCRP